MLEEGFELENKSLKLKVIHDSIDMADNLKVIKNEEIQKSIRQKTEIEKWSKS